jgi:polar amino acid transport system substrate-binding protein
MAWRYFACRMLFRIGLWLFLFFGICGSFYSAHAQTCGAEYVVQEGESLADIAGRAYANRSQWAVILYANQDRIGANVSLLVPGLSIRIPCLDGQQPATVPEQVAKEPATSVEDASPPPEAIELSSMVQRIEFLTADDYAPFATRSLPNGGMITNIVSSAMDLIKEQAAGSFDYNVSWVNDLGAHLNPLLITRAFDVGFPWLKPDCDRGSELSRDAKYRCQRFFFSDPLYEVFVVLFVKSNSPLTFEKDEEILGKTLCQPAGNSTFELDKSGRNWVKDNKIVLMQPQTIKECFRLLEDGSVAVVVTADLAGKAIIAELGLGDQVKVLPRPLAISTLHLILPKTHPHASTMLYYINTSIKKLKDSGEYERIVNRHLSTYWNTQDKK